MPTIAESFLFGLIPLEMDAGAIGASFTHDRTLVGVSMLSAVAASYAFLELAALGRAGRRVSGALLLAASGAMLGAGIWATHFIGMLAFESPLAHGFEVAPTALSAVVGIVFGSVAFVLAGPRPNWLLFALSGACAAIGAIVMHYLGMQGLRIEAGLSYRPQWVALTTVGALAGSIGAFWLAHRLKATWARAVAAFPMGAITTGLHYTDIAATVITPRPDFAPPAHHLSEPLLAGLTSAAIGVLAALALIAIYLVRRRAARGGRVEDDVDAEDYVIVIPNPSPPNSADTIELAVKRKS